VRVLVGEGRRALVGDPRVEVRELVRTESVEELLRRVHAELDEFQAEHLVVDALPDGVLGELRDRSRKLERTLLLRLHRSLPSLAGYDRVIDIEPNLAWFEGGVPCGPLGPRRSELEFEVDVLLVASDPDLGRFFAKLGRRLRARGLSVAVVSPGELAMWGEDPVPLRALDLGRVRSRVLVGRAGYNLTYEALSANVPHLAVPRARSYDDQAERARAVCEVPADPAALEARILVIVEHNEQRKSGVECVGYASLAERVLYG
jgi:hypothetical protein